MNIFDALKSLVTGGTAPTETPTQLASPAVPEPVSAVATIPAPAVDLNDDERPIDWDEEKRTDLPQRSIKRIAFLLKHETMAQTQERIFNDQTRHLLRRPHVPAKRYVNLNPQTVLVDPSVPVPTTTTWTK
jgi:hypothetical protein